MKASPSVESVRVESRAGHHGNLVEHPVGGPLRTGGLRFSNPRNMGAGLMPTDTGYGLELKTDG